MSDNVTAHFDGEVIDVLPNSLFKVKLDGGQEVIGYPRGKMKKGRYVRIVRGDRVRIAMTTYDKGRGRIVMRHNLPS